MIFRPKLIQIPDRSYQNTGTRGRSKRRRPYSKFPIRQDVYNRSGKA